MLQEVPLIQILMALYNGAAYLSEQLESIAVQSHDDWQLLVSDDASGDSSLEMIHAFAAWQNPGQVQMINGPCQGASANFMHLLRHSDPQADYLAFSDQDDVWLPHKLERAIKALAELPPARPAFYCSRTLICNAQLGDRRLSRSPRRALSFRNALVQNVAAGNTIVLNHAGATLARAASARAPAVVMHDWWLYQIITGFGGGVIYDEEPSLLYRQHHANEIGAHHGIQARISRIAQVLQGRFRRWNEINVAALSIMANDFTQENRAALEAFAENRTAPLPQRLRALSRSGVYRQSVMGNTALWLAALLGRL